MDPDPDVADHPRDLREPSRRPRRVPRLERAASRVAARHPARTPRIGFPLQQPARRRDATSRIGYIVELGRRGLEELDCIGRGRRVIRGEPRPFRSMSLRNPSPGPPEPVDLRLDVVDDQVDPIPAPRPGVGGRPAFARRPAMVGLVEEQAQLPAAGRLRTRGPQLEMTPKAEMVRAAADRRLQRRRPCSWTLTVSSLTPLAHLRVVGVVDALGPGSGSAFRVLAAGLLEGGVGLGVAAGFGGGLAGHAPVDHLRRRPGTRGKPRAPGRRG